MRRDITGDLEWLAVGVFQGRLKLPYDDASYLTEDRLLDFARINGLSVAKVHFFLEQYLLVPQREANGVKLFNAASLADNIRFVEDMQRVGLSLEIQQVIVGRLANLEELLWKQALEAGRKNRPDATEGSLADARVRVAASVAVVNAIQREKQRIVSGVSQKGDEAEGFVAYAIAANERRKQRRALLERLEQMYGL